MTIYMQFLRTTLLFSFIGLLPACMSVPSKPTDTKTSLILHQQHLLKIAEIQQFTLAGRIGVQAEGKGFSGGINWQHHNANEDIALYSPLGGQVASIQKSAGNVTLTDAKNNTITATDAETLTQKALGWKLPLSGLADWALGRSSNSPVLSSTWDDLGHLATLKQDGWDIVYQNYSDQHGYLLPNKILLRNDQVLLKLVIDQWSDVAN